MMLIRAKNPNLSLCAIFLVGLALSIGWGIRGNYGHETGAMFPGALAAMAVCLLSGRKDWQERVAYFALFGMLGWGFGGSASYMQVLGYTHSGHEPTQLYGFAGLFFLGFLWAALGGAGTAIPAVMDRKRLNELFLPTALLLEIWVGLFFLKGPLMALIQTTLELRGIEDPMQRQEQGLYWLDSDWFQVFIVLGGILLFDLLERRFAKAYWLPVFAAMGALIGYGVHSGLAASGVTVWMETHLIQSQGDLSLFPAEKLAVTNWPPVILFYREQLGWAMGLLCGVAAYFVCFGKFRCGSGLYLCMAVGWFVGFISLPVLGSLFFGDYGGLRLTPPRGDNWAGLLGTFLGAMLYFLRRDLKPVALASIVCGTIGGIGFSGIAWLKLMMVSPGHPHLSDDPAIRNAWTAWQKTDALSYAEIVQKIKVNETWAHWKEEIQVQEAWAHWQHANWHSFLEQSYGFVNGIGVAVALGILATRLRPLKENDAKQPWTQILAVTFALPALTFVNMMKNFNYWSSNDDKNHLIPPMMKAPWFEQLEFSAFAWFSFFFAVATAAMIFLMYRHTRRPLAIVPASWLGRGQLLFFLLLWVFVLGNFARSLPGFGEQRLLTEGTILFNAVIATILVLLLPRAGEEIQERPDVNFKRWVVGAVVVLLLTAVIVPIAETYGTRRVYGDAHAGHGGMNERFGKKANWKVSPLLKGEKHR